MFFLGHMEMDIFQGVAMGAGSLTGSDAWSAFLGLYNMICCVHVIGGLINIDQSMFGYFGLAGSDRGSVPYMYCTLRGVHASPLT